MDPADPEVQQPTAGRAYFIDERDTLLRATWYVERGFVNLSIWHETVCVATFHLAFPDAVRLITYLSEGLGAAAAAGAGQALLLPPPPEPRHPPGPPPHLPTIGEELTGLVTTVRRRLARWLDPAR
jgi:hypothetical protein